MIPEGLDKSISIGLALSSAALAWWAHQREMRREKVRTTEEAHQKYAAQELKAYAAQRDFGHIQRDLNQLKSNTAHLSEEADHRLDALERQVERMTGSLDILSHLVKEWKNSDRHSRSEP